MSSKLRARKRHRRYDIADVNPYSDTRRVVSVKDPGILRARIKLRELLDNGNFDEARILFNEMVKSSRFTIKNIWKVGAKIVAKTTPNELVNYLKAVYISSHEDLSLVTFNAYVRQLMFEQQWATALEEMELVFHRASFHHPIVLRRIAICSYNLWRESREKLPESYFEEDKHDEYDSTHIKYEKSRRLALKNLEEACKVFVRDVELLDMYIKLLDATQNEEKKREVILRALEALKQRYKHEMLAYLIKIDADKYSNDDTLILQLYESNPLMEESQKLKSFISQTSTEIIELSKDHNSNVEKLYEYKQYLQRLWIVCLDRIALGLVEMWFLELLIGDVFMDVVNYQIYQSYKTKQIKSILRKKFTDYPDIHHAAKVLHKRMKKYAKSNNVNESDNDSSIKKNSEELGLAKQAEESIGDAPDAIEEDVKGYFSSSEELLDTVVTKMEVEEEEEEEEAKDGDDEESKDDYKYEEESKDNYKYEEEAAPNSNADIEELSNAVEEYDYEEEEDLGSDYDSDYKEGGSIHLRELDRLKQYLQHPLFTD